MALPVKFADLHLHTSFSDGTYSPEELAMHARQHSLATVALTDHDTVDGCARMKAACEGLGVGFISGCELTAELNGDELHLIGYFIDLENAGLLEQMARFQKVRQERILEMVEKINKLKVPLKAEAVFAIANCHSPGRPHVGRALVEAGLCATMDEAFERFLKKNRPAWVPKFKISAADAISLVHSAGGLAVLAHPGLNRSDSVIPLLVEMGLDGLECYHTKHPRSYVEHYLGMARNHHLLVTGGSDCHGMNRGKPLIGSVKLPHEHVDRLEARVAAVREAGLQPSCAQ